MLLIFMVIKVKNSGTFIIKFPTGIESVEQVTLVEDKLKEKFGEDYAFVYDYSRIDFGNFALVIPKTFDNLSSSRLADSLMDKVDLGNSSKMSILQSAINMVNDFVYDNTASNPSEVIESGTGNCQALSLVLSSVLNKVSIENKVVVDDNHMYNEVNIDGTAYLVDMANRSIKVK